MSRPEARIRNLTPHAVTVRWDGGDVRFPSEGVARVSDEVRDLVAIAGVPVARVAVGAVTGLPEPEPSTFLLVSRVLAVALPQRADLLFPFGEIRDDAGQIVAVRSLARLHDGRSSSL